MEIEVDFTKSAQANAEEYFGRSKKAKLKAEGARKSAAELEKKLRDTEALVEKRKVMKLVHRREWYEKFNWFFTSGGMLAVGGRSADQNEELNSKHFEAPDLFFHAEIFGASVVILKEGTKARREDKEEAAQFAASFSKAWENSQGIVDVYSLGREQVTKSRNSGSLAKGSFVLKGEREWHKSTALGLGAFVDEIGADRHKVIAIAPALTCERKAVSYVKIGIGNVKKSDAAKQIARKLNHEDVDYVMQHMPTGPFSIK